MDWREWKVKYDISPRTAMRVQDTMRLLRPYRLQSANKVRVGRYFDGGYVMVDRFDNLEAAYSLGINDDVSWDVDIARLAIPVFQYDHTIAALPETHPLFRWEPVCISGYPEKPEESDLRSLLIKKGHESSRRLLLKCDIENGEWALLQSTPNAVLRQFDQIVIEVHTMEHLLDEHHGNNAHWSLMNLTQSHNVVHVHGNNYAPMIIMGGYPVPNVLELTLVRKDAGVFVPETETYPTPLDMPCAADRADLYLGRFTFD